ncbi:MAG TPA: hypothetical protein VMT86_01415 [Bryobacteraceae bacterium]|nr:hypothetical protein [Bryobacteraceae bacterium]
MRIAAVVCLLTAPLGALAADGAARTAIFLVGPVGAESARDAARGAASVARHWLEEPGSAAEMRRAGSLDFLPFEPRSPVKSMEVALFEAAQAVRDTDPEVFLNALDRAAQALAGRVGLRILVVIVEEPPLSTAGETQLKQIVDYCKANGVRVVVLDPGAVRAKGATGSFETLAQATGGVLIREAKKLEAAVLVASSGSKTGASPYEAAAPAATAHDQNLPALARDLPVYTRFMRISPQGSQSFGVEQSVGAGRGGITTVDGGPIIENTTGPMRGLFLVESPISALDFDVDDNAGTYSAQARVTQIARNASGKIVWRATKPISMHGPLKKLDARRKGNIYYMREVVLPAGQYTLEATVEDLLAKKSGGVREPLRTSMGTPSFTVSDAIVVRPFDGASDRFDADQVLNYDGNAISPLLDPVYRAGEPFTLQIYLIVYPDIYGAQPQMSLELLRQGHVVGRSSLPFMDKIRNEGAEGGSMGMASEQKHEFPYLATLRGVRLSAGDYEARVTVRQGKLALTRPLTFRVVGNQTNVVLASAAHGPAASASDDDAEYAEVKLPEVDPVHLAADAGVLARAEQQKLWDEASSSALSYAARLPNFRCDRETRRLTAPVKGSERFKETDSLIEQLTYEGGKESYRTLEVNGEKSSVGRDELKGVQSRGEFGSMLKSIFRPEAAAQYKWAGRALNGGVLCDVFDVEVPAARSNFILTFNMRQEIAGFHGRVFVDADNALVRRIVLEGKGLPKDFALQSPTFSLEYGMARVGRQDYLLPLRSVLQVRRGKRVVRNETQFRDYRKFEAASQIKFQ